MKISYKPCITVIIPCYNCEDTLARAVNSVLNQSFGFDKIELILYDDNSSDNTRSLIKEFSNKYHNIIPILSDENSGYPGKGRNEGIKNATADFIMFMDNDDEYDKDICKNLYEEINLENCDLVACNYLDINKKYENKRESNYNYHFGEEIENKVIFYNENTVYLSCRLVWACIFKKELIQKNNIKFPEDSLSEDVYFLSMYNLFANKTIYLKEYIGIYRHIIQNDSPFKSLPISKLNKQLDTLMLILEKYQGVNYELSLIFEDIIPMLLVTLYNDGSIKQPKTDVYPYLDKLRNYGKKINLKNLSDPILNIANKLILQRHFYWAREYLLLLHFIHRFDFIIKIYRNLNHEK